MNQTEAIALSIGTFVLAFNEAAPKGSVLTVLREADRSCTRFDWSISVDGRRIAQSYELLDIVAVNARIPVAAFEGKTMGERCAAAARPTPYECTPRNPCGSCAVCYR